MCDDWAAQASAGMVGEASVSDLLQLAERCEAATGPDPELDMLIDCALKGIEVLPADPETKRIESADYRLLGWIYPGKEARNFSPYGSYPNVTASIDAALTLVPEGWLLDFLQGLRDDAWTVSLCKPLDAYNNFARARSGASSAALAICAAALRARAA